MKTTSMETVGTGVLDKNKDHWLGSNGKAKKAYDESRHIRLHMSKYKKMKIYNPLCQTYSPTVVFFKSIFKKWTNIQEASG